MQARKAEFFEDRDDRYLHRKSPPGAEKSLMRMRFPVFFCKFLAFPEKWYILSVLERTKTKLNQHRRGVKMSNVCEICGKKKVQGARIIRRGLAKKKGGIGMHVVKVSPRTFEPNIQTVHVDDNGTTKTMKVCTACIRSGRVKKSC